MMVFCVGTAVMLRCYARARVCYHQVLCFKRLRLPSPQLLKRRTLAFCPHSALKHLAHQPATPLVSQHLLDITLC
jgi:hypothetical protein